MALFSRRQNESGLPRDIVQRVIGYIRTELRSPNAPDSFDTYALIYKPLHPMAVADPTGFATQLAAAVLPAGGEAARGGGRVIGDLLGWDFDDPNRWAMVDAGLVWLRGRGATSMDLAGYELNRWMDTHDSAF